MDLSDWPSAFTQNDVKKEMERGGVTYIMTNYNNTVLYTGVTSDIVSRVMEHKTKADPYSFTAKYNVNKLVYFQVFSSIEEAIDKEKYIKGKSRKWKMDLISKDNPEWKDLWEEIKEW